MPRTYKLKRLPIDDNRLMKICKDVVDAGKVDRELAQQAYEYFKQYAEDHEDDPVSKNLMVASLKLMQSSKINSIKVVETLIKLKAVMEHKGSGKLGDPDLPKDFFKDLDKLDKNGP